MRFHWQQTKICYQNRITIKINNLNFGIPVSQVEFERLFSATGKFFIPQRKAIEPGKTCEQVIVKQFLR